MALNSVVLQDVLNDILELGTIAVDLFVKNPASQAKAAAYISVANQGAKIISAQIAAASPAPAATTGTAAA